MHYTVFTDFQLNQFKVSQSVHLMGGWVGHTAPGGRTCQGYELGHSQGAYITLLDEGEANEQCHVTGCD